MDADQFWEATERAEEDFSTDFDVEKFRRKMIKLGHPVDVINERITDIHPELEPGQ